MKTHNTADISTASERDIVITRRFDAPRRAVFDAWTKPERLAVWWDPSGDRLAVCEIDLCPGGSFRFVHAGAPGEAHAFTGVYREIEPPKRLVFTTPAPSGGESVGTLVFDEQGDTTTLTMTIACPSAADRELLLKMRVDEGTARTLDNLETFLEGAK